ncbi:MAG: hypothetical protein II628_09670, partial [Lachnospiraceae bacterium]|nr:hypothetical protein [Lachnospiraceae bacterium]
VTRVDLAWMKKNSSGDPEQTGSLRTVWDGSAPSPIQGPDGPDEEDSDRVFTFYYSDMVDSTPEPDTEEPDGCCLIYYIEGTGTDTDGTVYTIHEPVRCMSEYLEFHEDLAEPEIYLDSLTFYSALDHMEVIYEIIPGDAEEIRSQAEITYEIPGVSQKYTLPELTGSGTIRAQGNAGGSLMLFSSGEWTTTIRMKYILGGEEKEVEISFAGAPEILGAHMEPADTSVSGTTPEDVSLGCDLALKYRQEDPHSYSCSFTKAEIEYFYVDSNGNDNSCGRDILWSKEGSLPDPFSGPAGPLGPDTDGFMTLSYSYLQPNQNIMPADARATRFRLHFYADLDGGDSFDSPGEDYTYTDIFPIPGAFVQEAPKVGTADIDWWPDLSHLRLTYDVEPAGASDIRSTAVLYLNQDGASGIALPQQSGDGEITVDLTLNAAQAAAMDPSSVPEVVVFLEYRMNGMTKSTDYTVSPSQTSYTCSLEGGDSSVSLTAEAAAVDYVLTLHRQNGDPHDYSADFREVRILWYETGKDTPAGETVIWDGSGSSPFTESGASYRYSDSIPLAPPGD